MIAKENLILKYILVFIFLVNKIWQIGNIPEYLVHTSHGSYYNMNYMVPISEGSTEYDAPAWTEIDNLICSMIWLHCQQY